MISASDPDERIESIDVVRGIALFGVLIVNLITEFRVSIFQQFLEPVATEPIDAVVDGIVVLAFQSKAFCLFSLLFGVGLAMLFERLSRRGDPLYWLGRRLFVLLALGLIHVLLIWNGDILTEYALAGFVVLPFLLSGPRTVLVSAAGFLIFYLTAPLLYLVDWPDAATLQAHVALANQVYSTGSLAEILRFSFEELRFIVPLHVLVFPRTIALFLFGMFLWKAGILKRAREFRSSIAAAALACIVAGAVLTAADFQGSLRSLGTFGFALAELAPVSLAVGYGAAIVTLMEIAAARRVLSAFAPTGRMAFTNYIMQSIFFGLVFFGYGLGQFGRMSAAAALALGTTVYIAQTVMSRWWLRRYRFGPIEWLWRTLMYGSAERMSKVAPPAAA